MVGTARYFQRLRCPGIFLSITRRRKWSEARNERRQTFSGLHQPGKKRNAILVTHKMSILQKPDCFGGGDYALATRSPHKFGNGRHGQIFSAPSLSRNLSEHNSTPEMVRGAKRAPSDLLGFASTRKKAQRHFGHAQDVDLAKARLFWRRRLRFGHPQPAQVRKWSARPDIFSAFVVQESF